MTAKLLWLYHRLRAMSPREVVHRIGEKSKREIAKYAPPRFEGARLESLPEIPGLRARTAELARAHPEIQSAWRSAAEARLRGWRFFETDWPEEWRWSTDPVTGGRWPEDVYCFSIDHRHVAHLGDVKYVWELNRLQPLAPAAALAFVSEDAELAEWCAATIEDWIDHNPPFLGVAWNSGIELALRVVSILVVASLLPERFEGARRAKLAAALAAHGAWIARYPSLHSSANNHLIAEAAGLFLLGELCPSLPGASAWAETGRAHLEREAGLQIFEDGVGAEQAPSYQALTMDWYALCASVGARLGRPLSEATTTRMAEGAAFLNSLLDQAGGAPLIGDDDACRALANGPGPEPVVLDVAAFWLAFSGDRAHPSARAHLRWALLDRDPEPAPLETAPSLSTTTSYSVIRAPERLLVFDHGPLGHLSIAAHGHADALSLWLHLAGRPVLIDAGTFAYHGAGAAGDDRDWRSQMRSTAVHPTLRVGDRDQSEMTGPFNWGKKARAWREEAEATERGWRVRARHDGYARPFGVVHERIVDYAPERLIVTDRLLGGEQPAELCWLLPDDLALEPDGEEIRALEGDRALCSIALDGERFRIGAPETDPLAWRSPTFGALAPAHRLSARRAVSETAPMVTTIRLFPS